MRKKHLFPALFTIWALGAVLPAAAEPLPPPDSWHFTLTPFFLQGVSGSGIPADHPGAGYTGLAFSENFLEQNIRGQEIHLKAQNNDWTLFANYQLQGTDPATGPLPRNELLDLRAQITRLGASYRFATWNQTDFEILAGTRYKVRDINPSQYPGHNTERVDNDEWWRNTFVGLRFFSRISENWSFIGRGDIAMGNGGKDLGWNVAAMIDYRMGDWGSFYFGYKLLDLDDENVDTGMERYSYDALEQGPFIGLSIRW